MTTTELNAIYTLFTDYDYPVKRTMTLGSFITIYGERIVDRFLNDPGSIHWTVTFTKVETKKG